MGASPIVQDGHVTRRNTCTTRYCASSPTDAPDQPRCSTACRSGAPCRQDMFASSLWYTRCIVIAATPIHNRTTIPSTVRLRHEKARPCCGLMLITQTAQHYRQRPTIAQRCLQSPTTRSASWPSSNWSKPTSWSKATQAQESLQQRQRTSPPANETPPRPLQVLLSPLESRPQVKGTELTPNAYLSSRGCRPHIAAQAMELPGTQCGRGR